MIMKYLSFGILAACIGGCVTPDPEAAHVSRQAFCETYAGNIYTEAYKTCYNNKLAFDQRQDQESEIRRQAAIQSFSRAASATGAALLTQPQPTFITPVPSAIPPRIVCTNYGHQTICQ